MPHSETQPDEVRREKSQAVLKALKERAIRRNAIRNEIRAISAKGGVAENVKLPGWHTYQEAERRLNEAVTEFEEAEGVGDE